MTARTTAARIARALWVNGWTVLHARRALHHQKRVSHHRHAITELGGSRPVATVLPLHSARVHVGQHPLDWDLQWVQR